MNFVIWDVDPVIFDSLPFRWYGLMWALGIALGYRLLTRIYSDENRDQSELDRLALYLIVGGVVGARLGHVLFYDFSYYIEHPIEILPIQLEPSFSFTGLMGLASHGGGLGVFISLLIFCRKHEVSFLQTLDRLTLAFAIIAGFIRIGNLLNSEIIGLPTNVPWAFVFTLVDNLPRHPTQLYEAIFYFFMFIVLYRVSKVKSGQIDEGNLFGIFMICLFTFRFLVEFLKEDQSLFEAGWILNMGQILSIPFILLGLITIWRKPKALI